LNSSVSTNIEPGSNPDIESSKAYFNLLKRKIDGFGYDLTYARIGARFDPKMGFELRNNNHQLGNKIWYGWINKPESKLFSHQVILQGYYFNNILDGNFDSEQVGLGWKFVTKKGIEGYFSYTFSGENIKNNFNIYNTEVLSNKYYFG